MNGFNLDTWTRTLNVKENVFHMTNTLNVISLV